MNFAARYSLWLLVAGLLGCQARAGMPCQGAGDCHSGLICVKPAGLGAGASGICEPARRALGDPCAQSTDCSAGLACSSEVGGGYYGVCQAAVDGGVYDLAADLTAQPDLTLTDLAIPPG